MIERILLAVDDSPDSLAATRWAITVAAQMGAQLRAVHALANHDVDVALETVTGRSLGGGRGRAVSSLFARVSSLAATEGVTVQTMVLAGGVGAAILDAARDWGADLVIIGKSARLAAGEPYVGSLTRHVLEFADVPVVVVPAPRRDQ